MGLVKEFKNAARMLWGDKTPDVMRSMTFVKETQTPFKVTKRGESDGFNITIYKEPKVFNVDYDTYTYNRYEARRLVTSTGPQYKIYDMETVSVPKAGKERETESPVSMENKTVFTKEEALRILQAFDKTMSAKKEYEIATDGAHTRRYFNKYMPKPQP